MSPTGITNIAGYFQRFGEPRAIRLVERDGRAHYEFVGRRPEAIWLAMPSGSPAYVFDADGRFVAWSLDPAENREFRETWPLTGTGKVDVAEVKRRFGL